MAKTTPNKGRSQTPKKQKNVAKQAPTNGVAKAKVKKSPKPKIQLIPDDLNKNLSRRQRKRVVHKVVRALKEKGTEDLASVDPNDATVKEIFDKIVKENKSQKSSEKKPKSPKKTPKKAPKSE